MAGIEAGEEWVLGEHLVIFSSLVSLWDYSEIALGNLDIVSWREAILELLTRFEGSKCQLK